MPHSWARNEYMHTDNRQYSNLGECLRPVTWSCGFDFGKTLSSALGAQIFNYVLAIVLRVQLGFNYMNPIKTSWI